MFQLSIDTSLGETSLALGRGDELLNQFHNAERESQAQQLVPWIEALLEENGARYAELDRIAVTVGPGGFTGIRIGLAIARALAKATKAHLAGFTTLEVIAYAAFCEDVTSAVTALLPAGRGLVYAQSFQWISEQLHAINNAAMVFPEQVIAFERVASTAPDLAADYLLPIHRIAPLLHKLARTHQERFATSPPSPIYIRPPDAKPQTPFLAS